MASKQFRISPEATKRIAESMSPPYTGDMRKFPEFLKSSAAGQAKLAAIKKAAGGMILKASAGTFANRRDASIGSKVGETVTVGGKSYVKTAGRNAGEVAYLKPVEAETTPVETPVITPTVAPPPPAPIKPIGDAMTDRAFNPNLQGEQRVAPEKIEVKENQLIKEGTGSLEGEGAKAEITEGVTAEATAPVQSKTATVDPTLIGDNIPEATAVKGEVSPEAVIDPEQQTDTALTDMEAVQGTAQTVKDAPVRTVQEGEMDVGSTVDMDKVGETFGTGEVKAASVKDELTTLMDEFEGGNNPVWATGGMRKANQILAARGLSASSMAGQAIIQAMMESALPIAQMEANNKQQMNLMKAEQRAKFLQLDFDQEFEAKVIKATKISDIANMNFNAEQQVALENARMAQTMELANLDSRKAMQMAQAAQISQLELTNLNNRQQAEVMNAQNFLAMDMANLDREQATEIFNTQNRVQTMFNDQAASNAAKQFNASSENQTNQFFAGLKTQVDMQNAAQKTAMSQFNSGQKNAASQFNASVQNQRDQFNAQNQMVIAQGNVQWRRAIATGDTAAINRANELNATALLNMSSQAYQNLWQEHADTMERSWKTAENAQDRLNQLAAISMQGEIDMTLGDKEAKSNNMGIIGNLIGKVINPFS